MNKEHLGIVIGKAAREARMALGLTQDTVAERINISAEFYARLERGSVKPSVDTLARMVAVLGVSADMLLGLASPDPRQRRARVKEPLRTIDES
jgi:transcriptional regulator with XRE-family HTH domain